MKNRFSLISMDRKIHKEKFLETLDRSRDYNFGSENCIEAFWRVFWKWFSTFYTNESSKVEKFGRKPKTYGACFNINLSKTVCVL